jgi:hypothetical protein
VSNAKARHRRQRRAKEASRKEAISQAKWDAAGGIMGLLKLMYPDECKYERLANAATSSKLWVYR